MNNMLFQKLKSHTILSNFIFDKCEENGICVNIDERIEKDNVLIIKPDEFYNSLNIGNRPASPDCMIIVRCANGGYSLTIVELKDIDTSSRFEVKNMFEKFETCFNDFICNRFADVLHIEYKRIKLYFVSKIEIYKRDASLKIKILQSKTYSYNGKRFHIEPQMPVPAIKPCY